MLLCFQLRHRQQIAQMIETVPLREPGQVAEDLGNEVRGLVGAALARRLARVANAAAGG